MLQILLRLGLCGICLTALACAPKEQAIDPSPQPEMDSELKEKVIYGDDDRKDVFEVESRWKEAARATVALIKANKLSGSGNTVSISSDSLGSQMGLCSGEPFYNQPAAAFCSGSLVGDDLVLTAGHCVRSASDCSATRFVFDYALLASSTDYPRQTTASNVYACAEILRRDEQSSGYDYALIKLDRKVQGRRPLKVRRQGALAIGDLVTVIGHPSGLPSKVASGGSVRAATATHYITNLDTYGGNSGSAVLNTVSGVIEGILVRGENDYVPQGACYVSNRCSTSGCRGEDVTRVSVAADLIPDSPTSTTSTTSTTTTTTQVPVTTTTQLPPTSTTTTTSPPPLTTVEYVAIPNLAIPDRNSKGIESTVSAQQAPEGRKVVIFVDIAHTYVGDLQISLTDPNGRRVYLQKNKLGRTRDLRGRFGEELTSDTDLRTLESVAATGTWKLKVADTVARDIGHLKSWKLIFK